jgi:hypothetical protein
MRGALALLAAVAARAAPSALPVAGALHPAEHAQLELILDAEAELTGGSAEGAAPPVVHLTGGALISPPRALRPGVWGLVVEADAGAEALELGLGPSPDAVARVPLTRPGPATARLPARPVAIAGQGPVELRIEGEITERPADLRLGVSEGTLGPPAPAPGGGALLVPWTPGPEPFARSVILAAADAARPSAEPASTVIAVRARATVPLPTGQPGAEVRVRVGGRALGPFVADAEGVARVALELRPGEELAEVEIQGVDGQVTATALPLAGDQRPVLLLLDPGRPPDGAVLQDALLFGIRADGRPLPGESPSCTASTGRPVALAPIGPGVWRALPGPRPASGDLRLDCALDVRARASAWLVGAPSVPARIGLRSSTDELGAGASAAELRAWVEDDEGARLPPGGLGLVAERGRVELAQDLPGERIYRYDGGAALGRGGDLLTLSWRPAPGGGPAVALGLGGEGDAVWAVARGADGRPVPGVPLTLQVGEATYTGLTDAEGLLRWTPPVAPGPAALRVTGPGGRARSAWGAPGAAWRSDPLGPPPDRALRLRERTGRVAEVQFSVTPREVEQGAALPVRVRVRLLDADGREVDDDVTVQSSAGEVSGLRRRADGGLEALWTPPVGQGPGVVLLRVESPSAAFATTTAELEVVPAALRQGPGIHLGWLLGPQGLSSPFAALSWSRRLPVLDGLLHARAWAGTYRESAQLAVNGAGEAVELELEVVPVGLGAEARAERGRVATWGGAGLVVAPYRLQVRYGSTPAADGVAIAPPGAELRAGVGWRLRVGEATAELGWLFLGAGAEDLGWQGQIGGLVATAGWRLRL